VKTTPETLDDNIRTPLEMLDGHQCLGINELMVSAISALRAGAGFGGGHAGQAEATCCSKRSMMDSTVMDSASAR
jgi:hypothetical protein